MLQQPVSGWCAQNTDSAQQSETTQEGDSSEDAAAGDTEDSAAGEGTAVTEDGENGGKAADTDQDVQEEDEIPTWQAETDEVPLDTGNPTMLSPENGRFWIIFIWKVWICPA